MQLRDAAETLGVHYQIRANGWVRQGTLRARKTPRGYEVSESDVRDLLARRAAGAEPRQGSPGQGLGRAGHPVVLGAGGRRRGPGAARFRAPRRWIAAVRTVRRGHRLFTAPDPRRTWPPAKFPSPPSTARPPSAGGSSPPASASRRAARVASPSTTTPPGERQRSPAMMAAACLREDHWQVHQLARGPAGRRANQPGCSTPRPTLIKMSKATVSAARLAVEGSQGDREASAGRARPGLPRRGHNRSLLRELARHPRDRRRTGAERWLDDGRVRRQDAVELVGLR